MHCRMGYHRAVSRQCLRDLAGRFRYRSTRLGTALLVGAAYLQVFASAGWPTAAAAFTTPRCVGACNEDGKVTVHELITMAAIELGNAPVSDCLAGDENDDQRITVDEILTAVNNALNGCTLPLCGNGVIDPGEECDDGNTLPYDGCSPSCQIEQGWGCTSEAPMPSRCYPNFSCAGVNPTCTPSPMATFTPTAQCGVNCTATATPTFTRTPSQTSAPSNTATPPPTEIVAGRFAYVTNSGSGTISVIDTTDNTVTSTFLVDPTPMISRIVIAPDGVSAYVTNQKSNRVYAIDTAQRTVTKLSYDCSFSSRSFCQSTGIAVSPDASVALVTHSSSPLGPCTISGGSSPGFNCEEDGITKILIPELTGLPFMQINVPVAVAFSPTGSFAVAHAGPFPLFPPFPAFVALFSAAGAEHPDVLGGKNLADVTFTPDGVSAYFVDSDFQNVGVIDVAANEVKALVPISDPRRVAITPDGAFAYVTSGSDTVSVIDTKTRAITSIQVGAGPQGIAITPDGAFAYLANSFSGSVSVINTATNVVVDTIPVGSGPDSVAIADAVPLARVGNPGNEPDPVQGRGAVDDVYRIGVTEVTNSQYAAFLNAVAADDPNGLYNPQMATDVAGGIARTGRPGGFTYAVKQNMGNKPVNFVAWLDAARFTNWLHNGRPSGEQSAATTENGAYDLSVRNPALNAVRSSMATWALPTFDEWYKAAYFDPTRTGSHYWQYPTRSNAMPTIAAANDVGAISNPGMNVANYFSGTDWNGSLGGNVTSVRSAGLDSASFYGTFDQGGNVWEWGEKLVNDRVLLGGAFNTIATYLQAGTYSIVLPGTERADIGFRVVQVMPSITTPSRAR